MEFVSPDPHAQVRAANVRATLDAFKLLPAMGERIIANHQLSIDDMRPDRFILVQRWLDALKEIQEAVGPAVVHRVGAGIIENAEFPPELGTLDAVLGSLDQIYYLNHRGNVGHYRTQKRKDGAWVIQCETPYPRNFERGLIQGFCKNIRLTGMRHYILNYVDGPPASDLTCTITLTPI
jgi:hypothetical protein